MAIVLLVGVAGVLAAMPYALDHARMRRTVDRPLDVSRRGLLVRGALLTIAAVLAPFARPMIALADTCGAYSCIRFDRICGCCGSGSNCLNKCFSNGTSCDGCYKLICRTCTGPYGKYQSCAYVCTSVCFANVCSPCGRKLIATCASCGGGGV